MSDLTQLLQPSTPGEQKLVEELERLKAPGGRSGTGDEAHFCVLGDEPPKPGDPAVEIRAETLRQLLMDKALEPWVSGGVAIKGAYISGELHLDAQKGVRFLNLKQSAFEKAPNLTGVRMYGLSWEEVASPEGLIAPYSKFETVVDLTDCVFGGDDFGGEVQLFGADIGGRLNLGGSRFSSPQAARQNDEAAAGNSPCEVALDASQIHVGDHVDLSAVHAVGELCFTGAEVGGVFVLKKGFSLEALGDVPLDDFPAQGRAALRLTWADIGSSFQMWKYGYDEETERPPSTLRGHVLMYGASAASVNDDWDLWPEGKTGLDGFTYAGLEGQATYDAEKRIRFLERQCVVELRAREASQNDDAEESGSSGFRPQPWRQLADVLRAAGHEAAANDILIEAEGLFREDQRRRMRPARRFRSAIWSWILRVTVAYGYRQYRAWRPLLALVFVGGLVFHWADGAGLMASGSDKAPPFQPWVYSFEMFGPVGGFGQKDYWPVVSERCSLLRSCAAGWYVQAYLWVHILAGWLLAGIFAAGFTGLFKKA